MPDNYQYVPASRRYFCLQQNPIRLVWYLYVYSRSLELHTGRIRPQVLRIIARLIQYRFSGSRAVAALTLPFYGNLCLPVHRGYKIFDFRRKIVVKLMRAEIDSAVVSTEIEAVRKAGRLDFAPRILNWDLQERWYEEEFINGCPFYANPTAKTNIFFEIFHLHITPCLEKMILLQPPQSVEIREYVQHLSQLAENKKFFIVGTNNQASNLIYGFIESIVSQVLKKAEGKIPLVFSHGDFSLVNILKGDDGIKVIDWEDAAQRNPLYDLYNYFFTESYYGRTTSKIMTEVNEAIKSLQERLVTKSPEVAATLLSSAEIYRRLYYLERLGMLLEREFSSKILEVILRSLDVFNACEENFAKS